MDYIDISRSFQSRIDEVLIFFPELQGKSIMFNMTPRQVMDRANADADAVWYQRLNRGIIRFKNCKRLHSRQTISHELTHILQFILYFEGEMDFPLGEKATDIWAMSRDATLCDGIPGYIGFAWKISEIRKIWKKQFQVEAHKIAKEAMLFRKCGDHNYLQYAERELNIMVGKVMEPSRTIPQVALRKARPPDVSQPNINIPASL